MRLQSRLHKPIEPVMSYMQFGYEDGFWYPGVDAVNQGLEESRAYAEADPFPHVVIDDFLPGDMLGQFIERFPERPGPMSDSYDRAQERKKTSYNPDFLDGVLRGAFYAFNSRPFVGFVENLTGIGQLIPDPHFVGGGLHETKNGGHLSVHADFNYHKLLHLERRVNVLIYLNDSWDSSYGGQLELWNREMTRPVQRIDPIANRCVIFSTEATSWHGHPEPLRAPDGMSRRSIALYYYTATWHDHTTPRTTNFRVRPGTSDRRDVTVRSNELVRDITPPIVFRSIRRLRAQRS